MSTNAVQPAAGSYAHAYRWFLLALAVIVAGFWPSFFKSLDGGSGWHTLHGVTATLWVIAIAAQSFTVSRDLLRWHRAVAAISILLVVTLSMSALIMIAVMQRNTQMPPFLPPMLAFIDIPTIVFFLLLVGLAIANVRRSADHKRYMTATVLLALPPATVRLLQNLSLGFGPAFHVGFLMVDAVLVALIVQDRRAGRTYPAYPMTLAFMLAIHLLAGPVGTSAPWGEVVAWYARLF
jgi:hypothetical protein